MKTKNYYKTVKRRRLSFPQTDEEKCFQRWILKWSKLLLFTVFFSPPSILWAASPIIVPNDIITVEGGAQSPNNPDIYVIDAGVFKPNTNYSFTVNRPKGGQANYAVDIEYNLVIPEYGSFEEINESVISFAANETQKTIEFRSGESLQNSETSIYLFFGLGNRTEAQYSVVKMNFTNPNPVTPTIGSDNSTTLVLTQYNSYAIGQYSMLSLGDQSTSHFNILDNTALRINRKYINHEIHPATISDSFYAAEKNLLLKPEQSVGTVSNSLYFLYKMTEDAIINDYERRIDYGNGLYDLQPPTPCFTRHADSIINLQAAFEQIRITSLAVNDNNWGLGDALPVGIEMNMDIPVRFGKVTTDTTSYDIGNSIVINIPVLNSKLQQKIYPNNEWLDEIEITLDGGATFISRENITFNGVKNTITAIATAVNQTGTPTTVTAEVLIRKYDIMAQKETQRFVYEKNASFTVTDKTASFQEITSIDFVIPENNQINLNLKNIAFNPSFNPTNVTFKGGDWTSSNPEIGEILATGVFIPKAYGKTTITFTSNEVTYRQSNSLPPNNDMLIQSFDIYVVSNLPQWTIQYGSNYYKTPYEDSKLLIEHNLRDVNWQVDGEVAVKVIHSDSVNYTPLTDAFEITPAMLAKNDTENFWITYRVAFDEKTFPKEPTAIKYPTGVYGKPDSIFTSPYRVEMAVPLKQIVGDTILTCILRESFNLHIDLPHDPQVKIVDEYMPSEAQSGDTIRLKYEVKYLPKYLVYPRGGFSIWWAIDHDYFKSAFRQPHPSTGKSFYFNMPAMLIQKGEVGNGVDMATVPDWLELTDMGGYYNGLVSIEYKLPEPLSDELRICKGEDGYFRACSDKDRSEVFNTKLQINADIVPLANDKANFWTPKTFIDSKSVKTYTFNFDMLEENLFVDNQTLGEWEGKGLSSSEIAAIVDSVNYGKTPNKSDPWYWFKSLFGRSYYNRFYCGNVIAPPQWGDLVAGITEHNSTDTIYAVVDEKFNIQHPAGGKFDLILSYPKTGEKRSYTYSSDNLANKLYVLHFDKQGSLASGADTLHISYINGDSIPVNKSIPFHHYRDEQGVWHYFGWTLTPYDHIIYEPSGIIGQVTYRSDLNTGRSGYITPKHMFSGISTKPQFKSESSSIELYVNNCEMYSPQLAVVLVDEDTGEKITSGHINHILRSSKSEMDTTEEDIVTWDEILATAQRENWKNQGVTISNDEHSANLPPTTIYALTEEGKEKLDEYFDQLKLGLLKKRISSFGGVPGDAFFTATQNSSTAGTVDKATGGTFLLPLRKHDMDWECYTMRRWDGYQNKWIEERSGRRYETAMEIISDGYYPKFATYGTRGTPGTDEYVGGNYLYVAGIGYIYQITVPLKKKTNPNRHDNVRLWVEKPRKINLGIGYSINKENSPYKASISTFDVYAPPSIKSDEQNLNKLSQNSVASYSRYANLQNAVINVNMPIEKDWNPKELLLTSKNKKIAPLHYSEVSAAKGYTGFENRFVNVSYRLNDFISYQEEISPTISYNKNIVAELPNLKNDETDPAVYSKEIKDLLKENITLVPSDLDLDQYAKNTNLGVAGSGMKKMESLSLSLPDPLPVEFQVTAEDNGFRLRGIISHNFIDDIPLVGQANSAMSNLQELSGKLEEFEAAIEAIKGEFSTYRPQRRVPRFSNASTFAGVRGYMEGYGKFDPYTGQYECALTEGGIIGELSASVYVKQEFGLARFGVGLDALVSLGASFSKPSDADWNQKRINDIKCDVALEQICSIDVYADAEAGIDILIAKATIGVYGNIGLENKMKVVAKPYLSNAAGGLKAGGIFNVHGYLYAEAVAQFLFWSTSKRWTLFDFDKSWYYPNDGTNPYKNATRSTGLRSLAQSYKRNSLAMPNTIIRDVAQNAYPLYFNNGNSLLFSNIKISSEDNDDRLSVYSSNNINDMLPTSTLPAYGFDVATSTNGVSVVAYEQLIDSIRPKEDKVSLDTYIKTQSNNVDVFAAVKNGSEWKPIQLSDVGVEPLSRKTDMFPKAAVSPNGSTAAVIWKSGFTKVDTIGTRISGDLLLSRYKNNVWSKPLTITSADNIGDYNLAIDGDSILIVTSRIENDNTGKIKLIYISENDSINHIETGRQGRKPQITRTGDNYYISFLGRKVVNDSTNVNDMYLLATTRNGQSISNLSGFAGLTSKVSFDYKLVGDNAATNINDLAILYPASKVVNENEMQTSLYAAKLGTQDGKIFASEPEKLLEIPADGTQTFISYDGYKSGNNLKAVAVISNESLGAIVVEENTTFENKIVCLSEAFNTADIKIGSEMNVEFTVKNIGYKPVTSLSVTIGSSDQNITTSEIMPSESLVVKGTTIIPENNNDSVSYSIKTIFADGSNYTATGKIDLTAYSMKVNLVSLKSTDSKNTAVVEIVNNSVTPLTSQHEITIGIYKDIFGETLYPGTALKTLPASEFYGDNGNGIMATKVTTTAFNIPRVDNIVNVYAIAKVKKNTLLRSGNSEASDIQQANKSYANIQLFPPVGDDTPTNVEDPKIIDENGEESSGIQIYAINRNVCVEITDADLDKKHELYIYSISGTIIHRSIISQNITRIALSPGVYIITAGTKTEKVVIL